MRNSSSRSPYRNDEPQYTLTERVRERVSAAEVGLDPTTGEAGAKHVAALWAVFNTFGEARREQRRQTGEKPLPGLRDATIAFRRAPSMVALVAVAAFLDERGLLTQVS